MTIITDQGFEISDSPDSNRPMSRKAKKRAAAKARREAAAAAKAEAEVAVEAEVVAVEAELEEEAQVEETVEPEVVAEETSEDTTEETTDEVEIGEAAVETEDTPELEDTAQPEDTPELDESLAEDLIDEAPAPAETEDPIEDEANDTVEDEANDTVEDEIVAVSPEPEPEPEPEVGQQRHADTDVWTGQQLVAVAQRVIAVFVVLGLVGYGIGFVRGGGNTARAEFVYTLDESVPDSFLREDRRLLTQVVTFESDAVLTPVAAEFDLTVDELRSKIEVDTLNLSEVLRLDVQDADAERAVALNQAVLDQYLRVIADASPAGDGEELTDRRAEVSAELELADAARLDLLRSQEQDVTLQLQQENLQQRISAKNEQVGALQQDLDAAIIEQVGAAQRATVANTLAAAEADLADLEDQLLEVGGQRAELATATTTEPGLLREIQRLEAKLTTIDNELAERELAPLVASPIRELSEPIVLSVSRHLGGLQGMALGLFLAMPIGAFVAFQARKRQLWFD